MMNEKKDNGLKQYFKENLVILLIELVIVVLLACICTLMLGGKPAWLPPVLAVFAYLMAEMRFLMAYLANGAQPQPEEVQAEEEADAPSAFDEEETDEDACFIPPVLRHENESEGEWEDNGFDEPLEEPYDEEPAEEPFEERSEEQEVAAVWDSIDELPGDDPSSVCEQSELDAEEQALETVELEEPLFEEPEAEDDEDFVPSAAEIEQPLQDDMPVQSVLDLGDDEDPFSH